MCDFPNVEPKEITMSGGPSKSGPYDHSPDLVSDMFVGTTAFGGPVPGICHDALRYIESARNPCLGAAEIAALRSELTCPNCLRAFDLEVRLRNSMIPDTSVLPEPQLATRITESLARVDLSKLDITDFGSF